MFKCDFKRLKRSIAVIFKLKLFPVYIVLEEDNVKAACELPVLLFYPVLSFGEGKVPFTKTSVCP